MVIIIGWPKPIKVSRASQTNCGPAKPDFGWPDWPAKEKVKLDPWLIAFRPIFKRWSQRPTDGLCPIMRLCQQIFTVCASFKRYIIRMTHTYACMCVDVNSWVRSPCVSHPITEPQIDDNYELLCRLWSPVVGAEEGGAVDRCRPWIPKS